MGFGKYKKSLGKRDFHKKGAGIRDEDSPFQTLIKEITKLTTIAIEIHKDD